MAHKGLVISIDRLSEMSGKPRLLQQKLRKPPHRGRCLLLDEAIQQSTPAIAVLVGSGIHLHFRLVQESAMDDLAHLAQPVFIIRDAASLKRALNIVLKQGVIMGTTKDVFSKVFSEEPNSSPPISLTPPQRFPPLDLSKKSPSRKVKSFKLERLSRR